MTGTEPDGMCVPPRKYSAYLLRFCFPDAGFGFDTDTCWSMQIPSRSLKYSSEPVRTLLLVYAPDQKLFT